MKMQSEDIVRYPRDLVFSTFRDHTPELVPYLPDIASIEVLERQPEPGGELRAVSLWRAQPVEIPALVRPWMKPQWMQWRDRALWSPRTWTCQWSIELLAFDEVVQAQGHNTYQAVGPGSVRVISQAEIKVNAARLPGVPRLMARRAGRALERFVVKLLEPNLTRANRGLEAYLRERA
jgi:hypothetical protein